MELGKKISLARKKNGYSQEALADETGLSLRTIQRIEKGDTQPRPYTLKVLIDCLQLDLTHPEKANLSSSPPTSTPLDVIFKINLSALLLVFIPFLHLVPPLLLWYKNRENVEVRSLGSKIISLQVIWSFLLLFLILFIPLLSRLLTGQAAVGHFPLIYMVYLLMVFGNIMGSLWLMIHLKNKKSEALLFLPTIFA